MKRSRYYEVENILDKRQVRGKIEYLIKWKGYSTSESTWEPLSNLKNIKEIIQKFESKNGPKKKNKNNKVITLSEDSKENKNVQNQFLGRKTNNPKKEVVINLEEKEQKEEDIQCDNTSSLFKVDDTMKRVLAVKKDENDLIAIVEKLSKRGDASKEYIKTDKLKKVNPWILIDYYESKIKFGN